MRKLLLTGVAAAALLVATGTAMSQDDIKQGGSMIVTYQNDVSTLDPAIGYDWQNWSIIKSIFDGLMDYEPAPHRRQVPQRPRDDRGRRKVLA